MSKKQTNKIYKSTKDPNIPSGKDFLIANNSPNDFSAVKSLTLYRYVYTSTVSMFSVLLLLSSLLLQGVHVAYASETEGETSIVEVVEPDTSAVVDEQSNLGSESVAPEGVIIPENVIVPEPDVQPITDNLIATTTEVIAIEAFDLEVTSEVATTTSELDTELEVVPSLESSTTLTLNETLELNDDTESDTDGELVIEQEILLSDLISTTSSDVVYNNLTPEIDEASSSDSLTVLDNIINDITSSTSATTTHESVSVTQSDTAFTFNKNECTQLTNGSFYCYQPDENILGDALFAAPDNDGDLEIFLVRNGEQAQITNNLSDDSSPYFDQRSNTIVWHRSIDDRYQIVSYDLKTGEETQLTHDSVNNMEPTRQGNYTVWQRWIGNSWNIVLYDGNSETEVTNDLDHNIAPHIQGSLVIWNKNSQSGEKTIEMYNIDSGTYVTVNDPDGLSVDNPRMVLIYDSLHPNGDITTKGFNILTGEFIELDTLPKQLPEIPDSETTTEIRALIQAKPEIKAVFETKLQNSDLPPVDIGDNNASNTKQIVAESTLTLDLSISTFSASDSPSETTSIVNDIPDLVIVPFSESTSTINVQ